MQNDGLDMIVEARNAFGSGIFRELVINSCLLNHFGDMETISSLILMSICPFCSGSIFFRRSFALVVIKSQANNSKSSPNLWLEYF
jgi:hypothetical protein